MGTKSKRLIILLEYLSIIFDGLDFDSHIINKNRDINKKSN